MDLTKLISGIATVAPTVALALGGPVAGLAVTALSQALTGKQDTTTDQLSLLLAKPNADQITKLKEAEQAFNQTMKELDINIVRIAANDLASARQREITTGDHLTPRVLAVVVSVGFFGILGKLTPDGASCVAPLELLACPGTDSGGVTPTLALDASLWAACLTAAA